jgi:CheY-like chemotaxis protein
MAASKQSANEMHVLLIEANQHIRSPLEQVILAHGHQCTAVESGEQGLSAIANHHYSAVICNQQLPGVSGMDFFKQSLRSLTGTTTILTATFADDYLVNEALAAKIGVFLEMPFKIQNLLACIEGRFSDICAGSLGRHLYITNGGQMMMISPACFKKDQVANAHLKRRRRNKPSILNGGGESAVSIPILGNCVLHGTGYKALKPQR